MKLNEIYHGDCLDLMKTMDDKSVDLILTSPPYNMRTRIRNGVYTTRENTDHFSKKYKHFDDAMSIDDYYEFHSACLKEMLRISPIIFYNVAIVTGSKEALFKIIGDFNKHLKDMIIWDKGHGQPAMHEGILNRATELILIFESPPTAGRLLSKSQFKRGEMDDIWRIKRAKPMKGHGARFPEELAERVILNWSVENDIIMDPFCGTGTTLKIAKKHNRRFIGCEISEEYVNLTIKNTAD